MRWQWLRRHEHSFAGGGGRVADIMARGRDKRKQANYFALMIVPTLCVVTPPWTLCVRCWDAERPGLHSHAERGNDQCGSEPAREYLRTHNSQTPNAKSPVTRTGLLTCSLPPETKSCS
ncbi:hypothetical protein DMX03_08850 [Pseudomonas koreensis]|nr:hypothetical protein DMX03_08850 [Pseudomonas koreensis]